MSMSEAEEGAAFRSTLQFVQTTMLNKDRYEELEKRLVDQSRKAAKERTEIEKRHYEQQQVREAQVSQQLSKYKKKENELKKILRQREGELSSATREAKKYRRKLSEAQGELEATRSYAQQLVSFHVPENTNVINIGNTEIGKDNEDRLLQKKFQDASSLSSAANEILRLREEINTLKGTISVKNTQLEGERELRNTHQKDHHLQHIKVLELEEKNRRQEVDMLVMKEASEKEKETISTLEAQVANLQEMLSQLTESSSAHKEITAQFSSLGAWFKTRVRHKGLPRAFVKWKMFMTNSRLETKINHVLTESQSKQNDLNLRITSLLAQSESQESKAASEVSMRQLKESLDKLDIENKSLVFEKNNALSTMNQQNLEMEALSSQLEALKILNSELEDENYNMRIKSEEIADKLKEAYSSLADISLRGDSIKEESIASDHTELEELKILNNELEDENYNMRIKCEDIAASLKQANELLFTVQETSHRHSLSDPTQDSKYYSSPVSQDVNQSGSHKYDAHGYDDPALGLMSLKRDKHDIATRNVDRQRSVSDDDTDDAKDDEDTEDLKQEIRYLKEQESKAWDAAAEANERAKLIYEEFNVFRLAAKAAEAERLKSLKEQHSSNDKDGVLNDLIDEYVVSHKKDIATSPFPPSASLVGPTITQNTENQPFCSKDMSRFGNDLTSSFVDSFEQVEQAKRQDLEKMFLSTPNGGSSSAIISPLVSREKRNKEVRMQGAYQSCHFFGPVLAATTMHYSNFVLVNFVFQAWKDVHLRSVISVLGKQVSAISGQFESLANRQGTMNDDWGYDVIPTTTASSSTRECPQFISFGDTGITNRQKSRPGDIISTYGSQKLSETPLMLKWRLSATIAPLSNSKWLRPHHAHSSLLAPFQLLDTLHEVKELIETCAAPLSASETRLKLERHHGRSDDWSSPLASPFLAEKKQVPDSGGGGGSAQKYFHHLLSQTPDEFDQLDATQEVNVKGSEGVHEASSAGIWSPQTLQSTKSLPTPNKTVVEKPQTRNEDNNTSQKQDDTKEGNIKDTTRQGETGSLHRHVSPKRPPRVAKKELKEESEGVLRIFHLKKYTFMMYQLSKLDDPFENRLLKKSDEITHCVSTTAGEVEHDIHRKSQASSNQMFHRDEFEQAFMKMRSLSHKTLGAAFLRDVYKVAGGTTVKLKKWIMTKVDQVDNHEHQHGTKSTSAVSKQHPTKLNSDTHPQVVKHHRKTRKEIIEEEAAARRLKLEEMEDIDDEYIKVHNLKLVFCSFASSTEANVMEAFELINLQAQLRLKTKKNYEIRRRFHRHYGKEEGSDKGVHEDDDDDGVSSFSGDDPSDDSYEKKLMSGGAGVISLNPKEMKEIALSDVLGAVASAHRMFDLIQDKLDVVMRNNHWTIQALFDSCDVSGANEISCSMFVSFLVNLGLLKVEYERWRKSTLYDKPKNYQVPIKKSANEATGDTQNKPRFGVSTRQQSILGTFSWGEEKTKASHEVSKKPNNTKVGSKISKDAKSDLHMKEVHEKTDEKDTRFQKRKDAELKQAELRVRNALTAAEESELFLQTIQNACVEVKAYDIIQTNTPTLTLHKKDMEKNISGQTTSSSNNMHQHDEKELDGKEVNYESFDPKDDDEYEEENSEEYEEEDEYQDEYQDLEADRHVHNDKNKENDLSNEYYYEEKSDKITMVVEREQNHGDNNRRDDGVTTKLKNENMDEIISLQSTQHQPTVGMNSLDSVTRKEEGGGGTVASYASTASLLYSVKVEDMKFNSSNHALSALPKLIKSLRVEVCNACFTLFDSVLVALEVQPRVISKHYSCRSRKGISPKESFQKFVSLLDGAVNGNIRFTVLVYLRSYESCRRMLHLHKLNHMHATDPVISHQYYSQYIPEEDEETYEDDRVENSSEQDNDNISRSSLASSSYSHPISGERPLSTVKSQLQGFTRRPNTIHAQPNNAKTLFQQTLKNQNHHHHHHHQSSHHLQKNHDHIPESLNVLLSESSCPLDEETPNGIGLLTKRFSAIRREMRLYWLVKRRRTTEDVDSEEFDCNIKVSKHYRSELAMISKAEYNSARKHDKKISSLAKPFSSSSSFMGKSSNYSRNVASSTMKNMTIGGGSTRVITAFGSSAPKHGSSQQKSGGVSFQSDFYHNEQDRKHASRCAHCAQLDELEYDWRLELGLTVGGATPYHFWKLVRKKAGKTISCLQRDMFKLIMLVKHANRKSGLNLHPEEPMRKLLDDKLCELLLIYVRRAITAEKLVKESSNHSRILFRTCATEDVEANANSNRGKVSFGSTLPPNHTMKSYV